MSKRYLTSASSALNQDEIIKLIADYFWDEDQWCILRCVSKSWRRAIESKRIMAQNQCLITRNMPRKFIQCVDRLDIDLESDFKWMGKLFSGSLPRLRSLAFIGSDVPLCGSQLADEEMKRFVNKVLKSGVSSVESITFFGFSHIIPFEFPQLRELLCYVRAWDPLLFTKTIGFSQINLVQILTLRLRIMNSVATHAKMVSCLAILENTGCLILLNGGECKFEFLLSHIKLDAINLPYEPIDIVHILNMNAEYAESVRVFCMLVPSKSGKFPSDDDLKRILDKLPSLESVSVKPYMYPYERTIRGYKKVIKQRGIEWFDGHIRSKMKEIARDQLVIISL